MYKYSIVIPAYKRNHLIKKSLQSIFNQLIAPLEIIVVDNNTNSLDSRRLNQVIKLFCDEIIPINLIKSNKNSGAIARNIGVRHAKGDLIAFLDSDVIVYPDYYSRIINIFEKNLDVIAVQGTDQSFLISEQKRKNLPLYKKFLNIFEQFFETSTLLNQDYPLVSPSLAVGHPDVKKNFCLETEWISTCAGVFKKKIFEKYSFPNEFITYSNNEYLFLSYSLFINKEGTMIYTSEAKYENIQTDEGRIPKLSLIYQIEVYDFYIFILLFKKSYMNVYIFLKSRIGHLIYNLLHALKNKIYSPVYLFKIVWASLYPFIHYQSILKKDLSFYEKDFH